MGFSRKTAAVVGDDGHVLDGATGLWVGDRKKLEALGIGRVVDAELRYEPAPRVEVEAPEPAEEEPAPRPRPRVAPEAPTIRELLEPHVALGGWRSTPELCDLIRPMAGGRQVQQGVAFVLGSMLERGEVERRPHPGGGRAWQWRRVVRSGSTA